VDEGCHVNHSISYSVISPVLWRCDEGVLILNDYVTQHTQPVLGRAVQGGLQRARPCLFNLRLLTDGIIGWLKYKIGYESRMQNSLKLKPLFVN
jgi:hypothetical protein